MASPTPVFPLVGSTIVPPVPELPLPLGILDHAEPDPVLDAPARADVLELGEERRAQLDPDSLQPHQRRPADEIQHGRVLAGHGRSLVPEVATARRRPSPRPPPRPPRRPRRHASTRRAGRSPRTPASSASCGPSVKGKKASEASAAPARSCPCSARLLERETDRVDPARLACADADRPAGQWRSRWRSRPRAWRPARRTGGRPSRSRPGCTSVTTFMPSRSSTSASVSWTRKPPSTRR